MGEYQEGGEGNQLEPQWDQIQGGGQGWGGVRLAVLPRDAELLVGQRPPEQQAPQRGSRSTAVVPCCCTHCTAPPQQRRAGGCGNTSRTQAEISLNTLFPCQLRLALPVSLGAWPCSCSELLFPPHPAQSPTPQPLLLAAGAPMLEPGQEEAAGGRRGQIPPGDVQTLLCAPCMCPDGTCHTQPCSAPWWPVGTGE